MTQNEKSLATKNELQASIDTAMQPFLEQYKEGINGFDVGGYIQAQEQIVADIDSRLDQLRIIDDNQGFIGEGEAIGVNAQRDILKRAKEAKKTAEQNLRFARQLQKKL